LLFIAGASFRSGHRFVEWSDYHQDKSKCLHHYHGYDEYSPRLTYYLATGVKGAVASNIPFNEPFLNFLGSGYLWVVPMPVISTVILVAIATYFLRNTVTGRQIYAVGSNIEASRLSGVKVERVQLFVYGLAGIMSAYAGILNAGLLATSATNAGSGTELDVVAAVIIGGASLSGGSGTIYGAVLGACIMALLRNAFVLLHLPAFIQTITIGVVLILAVASDGLRVGKKS